MLKRRSSLLAAVALMLLCSCVDQSGSEKKKDQSIAVTSVASAEILDALEVPASQVVGIPSSDSYTIPKRYQGITSLGTAMTPDMEILSSLNPGIVISPNSLESELASKYESIHVDSVFLNLKSVSGMYKSIEELGVYLGREKQAEKLVDEFVAFMQEYSSAHTESPKVLILMGLPGSYVAATESSYVGDLVRLAGGSNVYGDGDGKDFLNANAEDMLKKKPDIILRTSHATPEQVKTMFAKEFKDNDIWNKFDAVKNNKVYDLSNESFGMSANMKYKKALKELEKLLYAED